MFEYKIRKIKRVLTSNVLDLEIELGFGIIGTVQFSLWGCETTPEDLEQESRAYIDSWLNTRVSDPGLYLKSEKYTTGFVSDIYYISGGLKNRLSDELIEKGYAKPIIGKGFYSQGGKLLEKE